MLVANGRSLSEAYRQTWATKCKNVDHVSSIIGNKPHIRARIIEIREDISRAAVMDGRERREILATIARTPVTRFAGKDLSDPEIQKELGRELLALKKMTMRTDETGSQVTSIETCDRIAALREDAIMAGERMPDASTLAQVNIGQIFHGLMQRTAGNVPRGTTAAHLPAVALGLPSPHEMPHAAQSPHLGQTTARPGIAAAAVISLCDRWDEVCPLWGAEPVDPAVVQPDVPPGICEFPEED